MSYAPIITASHYRRYADPADIVRIIDRGHRGAKLLTAMCMRSARIWTRRELMEAGGFIPPPGWTDDGVTHFTAFEFWLLRINDTLPRTGWRINDVHNYRLQAISPEQESWLIAKLGVAA